MNAAEPTGDLHSQLALTARMYEQWLRQRQRLTNALGALERAGVSASWYEADFATAHAPVASLTREWERRLHVLMKRHPLASWLRRQKGAGWTGIGRLLGQTGPLSNFKTAAHLWSYCGLAVRAGRAIRKMAGERTGFNPNARVICAVIGESIVKSGRGGPWQAHYRRKYDEYMARPGIGPSECPFGQTHQGAPRVKGDGAERRGRKAGEARPILCRHQDDEGKWHGAHVHAAARRYAVKKFLSAMLRESRA